MDSQLTSKYHPKADYFAFYGGREDRRILYDWVYKINLDEYNILVRNPLDVCNFITYHTEYVRDITQYGVVERWLTSEEELIERILEGRKEDCDGSAVAVASILYSLEDDRVRLAIGHLGSGDNSHPNHAYCLIFRDDHPCNPYVLDPTGGVASKMASSDELLGDYTTLFSTNPTTKEIWLHGPWIKRFGSC